MTDKISVALIQTVQAWEDKAANFNHFEPLIGEASSADLIVLPEMFSTGFSCLLYTSPSPRDQRGSRMPSSA